MVSFAEFDDDIAELKDEESASCWSCCCPKEEEPDRKRCMSMRHKKLSVAEATETLQIISERMESEGEKIDPAHVPLTFVPDFIVAEIKEDSFRSLPYVLASNAVLLVADVCGFTSLCESYCQKGVSGVEELAAVLNGFMSTLAAMLIAGGGDILNFAGDAFLVQWEEEGAYNGMKKAVRKAYETAVALQTHQCLQTKNLNGTLRIKIGIAMGEITTWVLGSPSEFLLFVVAGHTLPYVQKAEGLCSAGDITVSKEVFQLIEQQGLETFKMTRLEDGFVKIIASGAPKSEKEPIPDRIWLFETCNPQHIAMARIFLIPSTRGIKSMAELQYVSELTMVTILFIALLNVEVAEPRVLDLTFDIILAAVKEHEGVLNKMLLFDKGCTFLVAFGLPYMKHSNDPARAVKCASDIVDKLGEIDILVSVGISSGTCFCGMVGHPQRQEFTVIGSHVNMAARIMVFYSDEPVALNVDTYHLSRDELGQPNFVELPARKLKGIDSPGSIYAYRQVQLRTRSMTTFEAVEDSNIHGSEREKERIRACVAAMRREEDRASIDRKTLLPVIVIKGKSNGGQSYVMFYTVDAALAQGYKVVVCCTIPSYSGEPFYVVARLICRMLGITMNESQLQREEMLVAALPYPDYRTLYLLNHLFHVNFPIPNDSPSDDPARRDQFRKLARKIIRQYCKDSYTLIAVDNAESMDDPSWHLLHQLAEEEKVVIVLSLCLGFREENVSASALLLKAFMNVNLETLEEDCFAPLLCWFLGVQAVHTSLFMYLKELTGGKTQLLKEIALSPVTINFVDIVPLESLDEDRVHKEFYVDRLQVLYDEKPLACDLKPGLDIRRANIPANINDAVKESLNNLTIQDRLLLKRAAVLGLDFDLHALEAVSPGMTRAEVLQSVNNLLLNHILTSVCALENRIERTSSTSALSHVMLEPRTICFCFIVYLRMKFKEDKAAKWPIGAYHRLRFRTHEFRSSLLGYMTKDQLYSMRMEVADNLEVNGPECAACKGRRTQGIEIRSVMSKEFRSYSITDLKQCVCLQHRPNLYSEISVLYSSMGMIYLPVYFKKKAAQASNHINYPVQALSYIQRAEDMAHSWMTSETESRDEESYLDPLILEVSIAKAMAQSFLLLGDTYSAASRAFYAMDRLGINPVCFHGAYRHKDFKDILPRFSLLYAEYITKLTSVLAKAYLSVRMYELAMDMLKIEFVALQLYPIDFLQVLYHMTSVYQCNYWLDERDQMHELENNIFKLCREKLRTFDVLIDLTEINGIGYAYSIVVETNLVLRHFDRAESTAREAIKILKLINETPALGRIKILLFHVHYHMKKYEDCAWNMRELQAMPSFTSSRKFRSICTCSLMLILEKYAEGFMDLNAAIEKCNSFASHWTAKSAKVLQKDLAFYASTCSARWSLHFKEQRNWTQGVDVGRACLEIASDLRLTMDRRIRNYWTASASVMLAQMRTQGLQGKIKDLSVDGPSHREEILHLKHEVKANYPLYSDIVKKLLEDIRV